MDLSGHFEDMLKERRIAPDWVRLALDDPDATEIHDDDTKHYIKRMPEFGNRHLRVVINVVKQPNNKGVTAFFDRRIRKAHAN